jgi:hypothetical protein
MKNLFFDHTPTIVEPSSESSQLIAPNCPFNPDRDREPLTLGCRVKDEIDTEKLDGEPLIFYNRVTKDEDLDNTNSEIVEPVVTTIDNTTEDDEPTNKYGLMKVLAYGTPDMPPPSWYTSDDNTESEPIIEQNETQINISNKEPILIINNIERMKQTLFDNLQNGLMFTINMETTILIQ